MLPSEDFFLFSCSLFGEVPIAKLQGLLASLILSFGRQSHEPILRRLFPPSEDFFLFSCSLFREVPIAKLQGLLASVILSFGRQSHKPILRRLFPPAKQDEIVLLSLTSDTILFSLRPLSLVGLQK